MKLFWKMLNCSINFLSNNIMWPRKRMWRASRIFPMLILHLSHLRVLLLRRIPHHIINTVIECEINNVLQFFQFDFNMTSHSFSIKVGKQFLSSSRIYFFFLTLVIFEAMHFLSRHSLVYWIHRRTVWVTAGVCPLGAEISSLQRKSSLLSPVQWKLTILWFTCTKLR